MCKLLIHTAKKLNIYVPIQTTAIMDRVFLEKERISFYFNTDEASLVTALIGQHIAAAFLKLTIPIDSYSRLILTEIISGERKTNINTYDKSLLSWNIKGITLQDIATFIRNMTKDHMPEMIIMHNPVTSFNFISKLFTDEGYDEHIYTESLWIVWKSAEIKLYPLRMIPPLFSFMFM